MCSAPRMPAPLPAVQLPPAPAMANVTAPVVQQSAPGKASMYEPTARANPTLRRKGKRGLTIPLTTAPGTTIPGM